jgi:hypothetical protein
MKGFTVVVKVEDVAKRNPYALDAKMRRAVRFDSKRRERLDRARKLAERD